MAVLCVRAVWLVVFVSVLLLSWSTCSIHSSPLELDGSVTTGNAEQTVSAASSTGQPPNGAATTGDVTTTTDGVTAVATSAEQGDLIAEHSTAKSETKSAVDPEGTSPASIATSEQPATSAMAVQEDPEAGAAALGNGNDKVTTRSVQAQDSPTSTTVTTTNATTTAAAATANNDAGANNNATASRTPFICNGKRSVCYRHTRYRCSESGKLLRRPLRPCQRPCKLHGTVYKHAQLIFCNTSASSKTFCIVCRNGDAATLTPSQMRRRHLI